MHWSHSLDCLRAGIPECASERIPHSETPHELLLRLFPRKKPRPLATESPLLPGSPRWARTETPRPRAAQRLLTATSGCARADTASPIPACAIFARYAQASPPAHTRRSVKWPPLSSGKEPKGESAKPQFGKGAAVQRNVRTNQVRELAFEETAYFSTVASAGSLERRHHLSSWLSSRTSMPGMTMNLQLSISRGSSSSGSWQVTRQY